MDEKAAMILMALTEQNAGEILQENNCLCRRKLQQNRYVKSIKNDIFIKKYLLEFFTC